MDFSFRTSATDKQKTVTLQLTGLELIYDDAKYVVPYKSITGVWLNKPGGLFRPGEYSCTLNINDRKPIYITSKNYTNYGTVVNQPNNYNSFIRVLHHHLQSKSKARYRFGVQPGRYLLRVILMVSIILACILFSKLLDVNRFFFVIPVVVSFFVALKGLKFCIRNYPKHYTPDNIPLNLLPYPVTATK